MPKARTSCAAACAPRSVSAISARIVRKSPTNKITINRDKQNARCMLRLCSSEDTGGGFLSAENDRNNASIRSEFDSASDAALAAAIICGVVD